MIRSKKENEPYSFGTTKSRKRGDSKFTSILKKGAEGKQPFQFQEFPNQPLTLAPLFSTCKL